MRKIGFIVLLLAAILLLTGASAAVSLPDELLVVEAGAFDGDAGLGGVLRLPSGVQRVGSRAFAGTGLHALICPEGCTEVASDVLAGGKAAYVLLRGTRTSIDGTAMTDVSFVFAPSGSAAAGVTGFYASETLATQGGLYYSVTDTEAIPLCAVDGAAMTGTVQVPKLVSDKPVRSLNVLNLKGCTGVTGLSVPSYMTVPEGMTATAYSAMTITAPVADRTEAAKGDSVTWTTSLTGAYGEVSYIWNFDIDGAIYSTITAGPTVTWAPPAAGSCVAKVTATDALNDSVSASGAAVTVTSVKPTYRALLVGNIYSGNANMALDGCDTDVAAMRSMLGGMTGTPYSVSTRIDLTAAQITSAISSTFSGAREGDVSLFYYSGHGSPDGSLVGTDGYGVQVNTLRKTLDAIPGMKIVIVDACHSGNMIGKSTGSARPSSFTSAFISGFSSYRKGAEDLATNGYVVMTACSKDQTSQSLYDGTINFGAFTYGVTYGSGYDEWNQKGLGYLPADTNSDGRITLGEAYSKAVERVNWLKTMVDGMVQAAQYYGDSSFVLWSK